MDDFWELASVQAAVESILEEATEPLYLVRPSAELIGVFVETAADHDSPPLHALAAESELKAIRNRFLSAPGRRPRRGRSPHAHAGRS
jgi:hypothetical protein